MNMRVLFGIMFSFPSDKYLEVGLLDHMVVLFLIFFFLEMDLLITSFLKLINLFYLFLAVLGLCCCVRAFSSCGERGLLFVEVCGLLRWLLLLRSTGSRHAGSVVVACGR